MSEEHKKVCRVLKYIERLLILISTVAGCVSISPFASLVGVPVGIISSIELKIYTITAGIKKHKSIIKKQKKKHSKIVFLAKSQLNSMEILVSKALLDSNISHDGFVFINNVLEGFYDMREEIKNSNKKQKLKLYIKQCYLIA